MYSKTLLWASLRVARVMWLVHSSSSDQKNCSALVLSWHDPGRVIERFGDLPTAVNLA